MKGLLVRVGIDSTDGCWNAPMRLASGEFAYATFTDTKPLRDGMARRYDEFIPAAKRFGEQLPPELLGTPTHLDPDFDQLTYGDQGQRGKRITSLLTTGDLLAFFAALRPVDGPARPLLRRRPACRAARHRVVRGAWLFAPADGVGEFENELSQNHDDLPQPSPA